MKAIILAAGRGSRMGALTDSRPKCLTPLGGQPLLEWQCAALRGATITDIGVVTGYRAEDFAECGLQRFHNPRWSETNMVASLMCADDWLRSDHCIISYGDIFYGAQIVRDLLACPHALTIGYDPAWRTLWQARFADPLSDAETFELDGDRVTGIGQRATSLDDIKGQYMGLLSFRPDAWSAVTRHVATLDRQRADKLDMTSLLSGLIAKGVTVGAVPVLGPWGEVDNGDDLALYERWVAAGTLSPEAIVGDKGTLP